MPAAPATATATATARSFGAYVDGHGRAVLNHRDAWFAHDAVFRFDLEPVLQRIGQPVMTPGQRLPGDRP